MATELSASDRSSLSAEQGPITMAIGGVMVFEGGRAFRHEVLHERISSRLHLIPKYRQRLQAPAPGVLNPVWVDDQGFDLGYHVRRVALPGPASETKPSEQLAAVVGAEMSRRLDRSRPLWELTVVEGLPRGRVALLTKMHHALVDGMAAVDIGTVLLDPSPEPLDIPPPDEPWQPRAYDRRRHLTKLGFTPALQARKLVFDSLDRARNPRAPLKMAGDLLKATELVTELARSRPAAPMTPLNEPIGPNRRYALHRAQLADVKAAAKAAGGTVNDAILCVVAGMLRRYLADAGVTVTSSPVALIPVSVRKAGEEGGNRISTVLVDLPIHEADPAERIRLLNAAMQEIKDSAAVRAGALAVAASGWAPPLVSSGLARAMGGVRAFNLVVSNVPGPQTTFYMNGSRMLEAYPCVPLNPANQGLNVGVISYDGGVGFGLMADRDLTPGLAVAAKHLRTAVDELVATIG
ncbi:wax ester/triacylglycerol synthase family O-acyltransferase [Paraconexibacter antarcticus]|uniref:Diacylglycerol O-acyltransferase n=1 Tax=Paraconexibacter antarcticus TaxID=2949664 RepID=A0ABY5DWM5_9ACTN|nr:wax ester/triacylglycerol synthase family O-acyltransferase [Paraconexibacter antarcticus]UTI66410.1 wax ester/triacylglycerol synthase family O-acyltransferase [Paraconexibacter antarcticus]